MICRFELIIYLSMNFGSFDRYFKFDQPLDQQDEHSLPLPFSPYSIGLHQKQHSQVHLSDLQLMSEQEQKALKPTQLVLDGEPSVPQLIQSAMVPPQQPYVPFTVSQTTLQRHEIIVRGNKQDTVQLNVNFKTLIMSFLKQKIRLNEVSQAQRQHIIQFKKRGCSYHSLALFCKRTPQTQKLVASCQQFMSSGECVRRILGNHCGMRNKLLMIKMVGKMRMNMVDSSRIHRWKRQPKSMK